MDKTPNRFLSLDVFRGMTIVFMIIVNNPGGGATAFAPLEHAKWFGFTPTDLVFPSFLFAVGNAMSFAMKKFADLSTGAVVYRIFKRAAIIFLLGYLMYWFGDIQHHVNGGWSISSISDTRIFGVLQHIALCYLFASLIIYFISSKTTVIIISLLLLFGYWFLLLIFGDQSSPYGMLTNAGTYLDKFLLGDAHLYHGEGVAFDPEGILSTLPAIVNVICGYYAGKFIQEKGKTYETISKLMLFGFLFIFIALCWNMTFPISKKLWTSPFVLLTVGIDMVLISALIYVIEILKKETISERTIISVLSICLALRLAIGIPIDKRMLSPINVGLFFLFVLIYAILQLNKRNWTAFFTTVGKNPLPIYLFSELFVVVLGWIYIGNSDSSGWINHNFFQAIAPGAIGSLLFAICYMLVCWLFGKILDKNKIYIRV